LNPFAQKLLAWYARHKRALPWRKTRDPYRIWLSEVLLQQTRVEAVIPYYHAFLKRFPDVFALANAPLDDVMKTWEGAGYYARARNLHRTANIVAHAHGGKFPRTVAGLLELPGIGRYTAGAIASIAFNADTPVVDGNVIRVLCRYFGIRDDPKSSAGQARLWELAEGALPRGHAREFNQALMELGATVCLPRQPHCLICPIHKNCLARQDGLQAQLPVKRAKRELPHRTIAAGVIWRRGRILIQQRVNEGLLGGLWEFPGGKVEPPESLAECVAREVREELGIAVHVGPEIIAVDHAYSHFSITLHAFACEYVSGRVRLKQAQAYRWVKPSELELYAFPAANKKIISYLNARIARHSRSMSCSEL
jgi:A/G-specific adenine glycosylase